MSCQKVEYKVGIYFKVRIFTVDCLGDVTRDAHLKTRVSNPSCGCECSTELKE